MTIPVLRDIHLSARDTERLLGNCRRSAVVVYLALMSAPDAPIKVDDLAASLGVDRKTVYVALRELVAAGLIEIDRQPGGPSRYRKAGR